MRRFLGFSAAVLCVYIGLFRGTWQSLQQPRPAQLPDVAQLLAGPERIESGWWDGGDIRRDYYLAQWADGRHAWVWCEPGRQGWYLHGWFG